MSLRCERNTPNMHDAVISDAREALERTNLQADFEHGQWFVTDRETGAQWAVNDAEGCTFDYEQVTQGDDEL